MNGYATIPVVVGSVAEFIQEDKREVPEMSHKWRCYVKAQPSLIKSVQFRLHESFVNPVRTAEQAPFEITEYGWGEFNIQIKITLFNGEKIQTNHYLALHSEFYPRVSERVDTIVYRGKAERVDPEYDFVYEGESEEYSKIEVAIAGVLELYEQAKAEL